MGIVTKTGDKGETGLVDGSRIAKDNVHLEAYGTVDELNSWLGVILADHPDCDIKDQLARIQSECFVIGSHLATPSGTDIPLPSLDDLKVSEMENEIKQWEDTLEPLKNFILPGGHPLAAQLHHARTLTRRAERHTASLCQTNESEKSWQQSLQYLNRLSDWFFTTARLTNHSTNTKETPWVPQK